MSENNIHIVSTANYIMVYKPVYRCQLVDMLDIEFEVTFHMISEAYIKLIVISLVSDLYP